MRNPVRTPFAPVFQNEVLLASRRVAPYAMALLFAGNALLWWGWGPATGRGWATNADFFIAGVLPVYSFMTLPLFTALIMADPVIRDLRTGIAPLIFSKPVSRAEYLLGKFFGNFFVLVCCQAAFVLTLFVLQAFRKPGMIVQDVKVFPYLKHFLVLVVISHLAPAAFYFTVGTLTRNAKIVYGLGVSFYPLYISYQVFLLKRLPSRWRIVLDPLLMNWGKVDRTRSAEVVNQLVITYDSTLIVNRAMMILFAAICLTILYVRFATAERPGKVEKFSVLNLSTAAEGVYYPENSPATRIDEFEKPDYKASAISPRIALPEVARVNEGIHANVNKLIAALGVEFRLLRAERSLVVLTPLAILLSIFDLAFYQVVPEVSYSATYASGTAKGLLLFLVGMTVFYTGEAMHRDRDLKFEPILWSQPVPNRVLLWSKFLSTLLLALTLVGLVVVITGILQVLKHNGPIDLPAYARIYLVIVAPNAIFMTAAALMLSVWLRDRYLTYAVAIGVAASLFYLYSQGHNHWLYNPLLIQAWDYQTLIGGPNQSNILLQRSYVLLLSLLFIALAHLGYQRRSLTRRAKS